MNENLKNYLNKLNCVYNNMVIDFENEKVTPKEVDYLCGQLDTLENIINELNPIAYARNV